jgi:hypothetical protein
MSLHYWYMLPVSILIATIAMASGVEGATFFSPLFILGLRLPPDVAIGIGLITEVFGFASGLYAYTRKRFIDFRLGAMLLMVTIPMALLGTWVSGHVEPDILKTTLAVGLFAVAASFLRTPGHEEIVLLDTAILHGYGGEKAETCLVTAEGEEIRYSVCNRTEGQIIAGLGGLFIGMISTGLGELNGYFLLQRCRVPSKVSVATSVFVVAFTALIASVGHAVQFIQSGTTALDIVLSLLIFTIPGVIIGGQLGSAVASRIPQQVLERSMGVLFALVGALMLAGVIMRGGL